MKSIIPHFALVLCLLGLSSCSDSNLRVANGAPYTLTGMVADTLADSTLTLIIDRHEMYRSVQGDTVPAYEEIILPVADGHFSYQGSAPLDADELYLYNSRGRVTRLYGLPGASLNVQIMADGTISQDAVDTTDVLRALLLRDSIPAIHDSLRVRRTLGRLPDEAKPAWLMQSINLMLDQMSRGLTKSIRLPRVDVPVADTVYHILGSRPEALLMLFWSMEDSASMDSLRVFRNIARDYGLYDHAETFAREKSPTRRPKAHRIELLSICIYAPDSAAWTLATKEIPGRHAILPGGLANPLAVTCQVEHLPWLLMVDRFSNYQTHDVWGDELYKWLDKAPLNSAVNKKK